MKFIDQIKADFQRKFEMARKLEQPPAKPVSEAEHAAQTAQQADILIKAALRKAVGR